MKLIVSRTDRLDVTIYCFEVGGILSATHIEADIPKSVGDVEKATFTFRKPNHSDSQAIFKQCNFKPNVTGEGDVTFNVSELQDVVLRVLLVDWDLTDDDGKKLPLSAGNVNALDPAVARSVAAGCLEKIRL